MIVIRVSRLSNGDLSKTFGGIECDVVGCGAIENTVDTTERKNLIAAGWFIRPGLHRCPKHYDTDAPGRGIEHREDEQVTKRI